MKIGSSSGRATRFGIHIGNRKKLASEAVPETPQKNDFVSKMVTAVKKMDVNQMNEQINKMSQSISSLQSLLNTFSGSGQKHSQPGSGQHPFSFRKD